MFTKTSALRFLPQTTIASLAFLLLSALPAASQQTPGIERNPDAIAIIQATIDASGGVTAINGLTDIVATGTIVNRLSGDNQIVTPITISARGMKQLRIDSAFSTGKQSFRYSQGSLSRKDQDGSIVHLHGDDGYKQVSHLLPIALLLTALQDTAYSIVLRGTSTDETNGRILYHILLRRHRSGNDPSVHEGSIPLDIDYSIDTTSHLVVHLQHAHLDRGRVPNGPGRVPLEQYDFAAYGQESGLLLPHQVTVSVDKRPISTLTLSGYRVNTDLTDKDFNTR